MKEVLDYRQLKDVTRLAGTLLSVPAELRPRTCAFLSDQGLMRSQWWAEALLWVIRKRHGTTLRFWQLMEQKSPGHAMEYLTAAGQHIIGGRDRTTIDAAGGFNKYEVHLLWEFLQQVRSLQN